MEVQLLTKLKGNYFLIFPDLTRHHLIRHTNKDWCSQLWIHCTPTVPLLWLHISHIGISASVGSPVVLGILFWRVITVETAHLRCTKRERRFDNFNPSHYYWNWRHHKQVVLPTDLKQVMLQFCNRTQHHVQLQRENGKLDSSTAAGQCNSS